MSEVRDHEIVQWVIMGLSVVAFIILMKAGASYLPNKYSVTRNLKQVLLAV